MVYAWFEALQYNSYFSTPSLKGMVRHVMRDPSLSVSVLLDSVPPPPEVENKWVAFLYHHFWLIFSSSYRSSFLSAVHKINRTANDTLIMLQSQIKKLAKLEKLKIKLENGKKHARSYAYFGKIKLIFNEFIQHQAIVQNAIHKTETSIENLLNKKFSLIDVNQEISLVKNLIEDSCRKIQNLRLFVHPHSNIPIAAKVHSIVLPAAKKQALKDIGERIHPDLQQVWGKMFDKFEPEIITGWSCDPHSGEFTLSLKRPMKMWVPSTNEHGEEDPKGGIVLMLGDAQNTVCGVLDKETREMRFTDGFYVRCKYTIPFVNIYTFILPNVFRLTYESSDKVIFGAGMMYGGFSLSRDRERTVKYLIDNWGNNGVVVEDPDEYISQRL